MSCVFRMSSEELRTFWGNQNILRQNIEPGQWIYWTLLYYQLMGHLPCLLVFNRFSSFSWKVFWKSEILEPAQFWYILYFSQIFHHYVYFHSLFQGTYKHFFPWKFWMPILYWKVYFLTIKCVSGIVFYLQIQNNGHSMVSYLCRSLTVHNTQY